MTSSILYVVPILVPIALFASLNRRSLGTRLWRRECVVQLVLPSSLRPSFHGSPPRDLRSVALSMAARGRERNSTAAVFLLKTLPIHRHRLTLSQVGLSLGFFFLYYNLSCVFYTLRKHIVFTLQAINVRHNSQLSTNACLHGGR